MNIHQFFDRSSAGMLFWDSWENINDQKKEDSVDWRLNAFLGPIFPGEVLARAA